MKAAQDVEFNLVSMCGPNVRATVNVRAMVNAYSRAIGAPCGFIFFPLLTVIAACMGVKAAVNVNSVWTGALIVWTIVAARKEKRSLQHVKD